MMLAFMASACAHTLDDMQTSLVLAGWGGYSNLRQPAEWGCHEPETICLDALGDVQFVNSETISGPTLPASFVAATVFHSPPRRGVRLLVAVMNEPVQGRRATILQYVGSKADQACVDTAEAKQLGIRKPHAAQDVGSRFCFSEY
jgi:hypothetical protein